MHYSLLNLEVEHKFLPMSLHHKSTIFVDTTCIDN